jgi:hypothetical protein
MVQKVVFRLQFFRLILELQPSVGFFILPHISAVWHVEIMQKGKFMLRLLYCISRKQCTGEKKTVLAGIVYVLNCISHATIGIYTGNVLVSTKIYIYYYA